MVDNTDVSDDVGIVCEFKRGGMCISHRSMGTKYVETWKEWTKMKNGLYGYVNRKKTKYVCRFRGVVKSNCDKQKGDGLLEGVAESNCDNLVLGMDRTTMSKKELKIVIGATIHQLIKAGFSLVKSVQWP